MFPDVEFDIQSLKVSSGVRDQPMSDSETLEGAVNRITNAEITNPNADYWVGIEGGIENHRGQLAAYAWIAVKSGNAFGKARTGMFYLPKQVAELVHQGKELGEADDIIFGRFNSKQDNGAVGILTGDVIDRIELYSHAVILSLIPFRNPKLYEY